MSPSPIGGSGGGGFDRYNIQPKKKKETTDGSEAVVPKVTEPPPASPPRKSDDSVASTGDTSDSGLGERQRGGHPDLYKKPQPQRVKSTTEEATPGINIQDELTLSKEAQALPLPPLDPARAAYEAQARKHPPEEFHDDLGKLDHHG